MAKKCCGWRIEHLFEKNIFFICPYIGTNHPNSYFSGGLKPPTIYRYIYIYRWFKPPTSIGLFLLLRVFCCQDAAEWRELCGPRLFSWIAVVLGLSIPVFIAAYAPMYVYIYIWFLWVSKSQIPNVLQNVFAFNPSFFLGTYACLPVKHGKTTNDSPVFLARALYSKSY